MTALRPNYSIFQIDLSQKGSQDIAGEYDYFHLTSALDINGNPALSVLVNVSLSRSQGDLIPVGLNGKIRAETDFYRLTWDAQPNVIAKFLASQDDANEGVSGDFPPTRQVITTSAGTLIQATRNTVGTAAVVISPASGTRQSLIIKNTQGPNGLTLFVGGAGVDTTNGFPILPGESLSLAGQTAPVYGVSTAAGCTYAALVEF
jgi:hypothetical protein